MFVRQAEALVRILSILQELNTVRKKHNFLIINLFLLFLIVGLRIVYKRLRLKTNSLVINFIRIKIYYTDYGTNHCTEIRWNNFFFFRFRASRLKRLTIKFPTYGRRCRNRALKIRCLDSKSASNILVIFW